MSQVLTGAQAVLTLQGTPILFASGITVSIENRIEEIPQLDDVVLAELAENGSRVELTVNYFKNASQSASDFSLNPSNPRDLTLLPDMIFHVLDNSNDNAEMFTVYGVRFRGGSGTLDARGVWTGVWNFSGIRAQGL